MTEQQYRVIADRDKGDDVDHYEWDAQRGDHVVWEVVNDIGEAEIVRIERPVPTTDEPQSTYTASDVQEAFERGVIRGEEDANERDHSLRQYEKMHAPHPLTREQIAEAIYAAQHPDNGSRWLTTVDGSPNVVSYVAAEAVLAMIQNGADR